MNGPTDQGAKSQKEQNDYERAINALIPIAEQEAKDKCRAIGKRQEKRYNKGTDKHHSSYFQYSFESEFFHKAINRLAFEAGLRSYK